MTAVTLDTSFYIGALNSRRHGSRVLGVACAREIRIVISDAILALECAVAARSEYIVTWDKDLLQLGEYAGIRILTPVQFIERGRVR